MTQFLVISHVLCVFESQWKSPDHNGHKYDSEYISPKKNRYEMSTTPLFKHWWRSKNSLMDILSFFKSTPKPAAYHRILSCHLIFYKPYYMGGSQVTWECISLEILMHYKWTFSYVPSQYNPNSNQGKLKCEIAKLYFITYKTPH